MQLEEGLNVPVPLLVKLTDPVGVILVPPVVSVTVTVHVVPVPTGTEIGLQVTIVELARVVTVTSKAPGVDLWLLVGVYDPVILCAGGLSEPGLGV